MTLFHSPSVQSPKAYDLANLGGAVLGARIGATPSATQRGNLRTAMQDSGYRYKIHPQESASGLTDADLTFGFEVGNVLRYGADASGAADATAAFNKATMSTLAAATIFDLARDIVVPAGKYTINGTVYVRKGQRLSGGSGTYIVGNLAGTGPTFKMGWGFITGVATVDPGGQPCQIDNLFVIGGPPAGVIEFNTVAGAFAKDLFISNANLAIACTASSDINLSNIILDLNQQNIVLTGSFNIQGALLKFFNSNQDIAFGTGCYACLFDNCLSEYNQFSSVVFVGGATGIRDIQFNNCMWTYNVQYAGYTGSILNQAASAVQASFNSCYFNNMPGYAYHGSATASLIDFDKCIFDGSKSIAGHAQSVLAAAINTANETVRMKNCTFRNMQCNSGNNTPIAMGGTLVSNLEIDGGEYGNNFGPSFIGTNNSFAGSSIKVRNLQGDAIQTLVNNQSTVLLYPVQGCKDWFGPISTSGASHLVLVPYQFANAYRITLRANINAGGGAQYRNVTVTNAVKSNDFAAGPVATSYLTTSVAFQGAAHGNAVLATVVEFGAVGGTQSVANSNSGSLAISWPSTYSSEFLDVEMLA